MQKIRRGSIYAGDKVIARSKSVPGSRILYREYPEPNISYLCGYFDPAYAGVVGIEAKYDSQLSGSADSNGIGAALGKLLHNPPVGNDIHLTIDPDLQEVAQQTLGQRKGAIVLLDVQTGAIIAAASWPHVDPQQLMIDPLAPDAEAERQRAIDHFNSLLSDEANSPFLNRATQGLYPPGSIFKTVTVAAALDTGVALPDSLFTDESGTIQVVEGGYLHQDCSTCRPPGHGSQYTLTEAYMYSLNVVFAQLGVQTRGFRLDEYARRFDLLKQYDLGVGAEAGSIVNDSTHLQAADVVASTAYGQGELLVTPLHMAVVSAAIARGGDVPQPYLVEAVTEAGNEEVVEKAVPHTSGRAVSETTARQVREMMLASVESGYAQGAAIEGYAIGGKTGTAEIERGATPHSWFLGWGGRDMEHIQYAAAVIIEEGGDGTGAALQGFRTVIEAAVQRPEALTEK